MLERRKRRSTNKLETNQRAADCICREFEYEGRTFAVGDCVALLDGKVVAVTKNLDEALEQLRAIAPERHRGMLLEVGPPVGDRIR